MKNILPVILFSLVGCTQIETGYVGIEKHWSKVKPEAIQPGFEWYNPISTSIVPFEIREQRWNGQEDCFTKDAQNARIDVSMNFQVDPARAVEIYSTLGDLWDRRLLNPMVQGRLKDVTGQFTAEELVAKREHIKATVQQTLKELLAPRGIIVTNVEFTNITFSQAYTSAIEAKVVASQRAAEAKNQTVTIEEQARQRVIAAEADAKAIRIQAEALSNNKALVEFEAVKKWDGKLPQTMFGNSVPFVNVTKEQK